MNPQEPQLTFREVLRIRSVQRLWLAQLVSVFGDFLAIFAVLSVVTFKMHGTADQVSFILISYLLPLAIVSPLAGVYVDRWNVKWIMIGSDLIRGVLVIGLLFANDLLTIYGIFMALSTVSAFFMPSQSVTVRTLTPSNGLMAANALMSQAVQGMQIIAPAIAGLMVQGLGANSCFLFDSFSFFFSAAVLTTIAIHREPAPAGQVASSVLSSMRQGVKFIFTHSTISFVVISMMVGMFAVRCFGALLSIYVRDILKSDSRTFGLLNSGIGIGMIIGSQIMPRLARKTSQKHLVAYGLGGMGVAVLVTAVFTTLISTAISMLGIGFFVAFVMISAQTVMQQGTPREMLGRVTSSLMSVLAISQVLAMFVAGPVAQSAGIRNLYYGSAAMLVMVGVVGYRQLREPKGQINVAA